MKSLSEKASLIKQGTFKAPSNLEEISLTKLELFKIFKKFDRNLNGFLSI